MPVGQVVKLVAGFALEAHGRHKTADFVFHATASGGLERHAGRRLGQQRSAALHRTLQGFDHGLRARMGADLQADRQAEHVRRTREVDDLGLGRQGVGDHRQAALGGLQACGTPVDIGDTAFGAVDGDPVIDLVRLGGIEDDPGKHVAQGALQGQADDDRHGAGGGQHALDRQVEHVGHGGDDRDEENHRAQQVLQQAPGMADPLHHHRAEQHREGAGGEQPPADLQRRGGEVQGGVIGIGRRLHGVHAVVEQHGAEHRKNHQPCREFPVGQVGGNKAPHGDVDQDQRHGAQHRVISDK